MNNSKPHEDQRLAHTDSSRKASTLHQKRISTPRLNSKAQSSKLASSLSLMGAVITTIANFGVAWLVGRGGNEYAGVFFVSAAVATIIGNSCSLGTMTGLVYFMPKAIDNEQPSPRPLITMALKPVFVVSTLIAVVLFAASEPFSQALFNDRAADIASMLRIMAISIPAWAATSTLLGATRGLGTLSPTVFIGQILRPFGQIATIGTLFALGGTPTFSQLALAWTMPVAIGAAMAVLWIIRIGGANHGGVEHVSSSEFWEYARPRAASTTLQIALERIDVVLVTAIASTASAGIYGAVSRYATAGNFLIYAVGQASSPNLRRAIHRQRLDNAQRQLKQTTGWIVLLAWPYFLLVTFKSETLARILNPDFSSGATALTILALGMMASALAGPIDLTLLMLGRSKASLAAISLALVADIGLVALLVPNYGLKGAAIAWVASVIIVNGVATYLVARISGLRAQGRSAAIAGGGALLATVPVSLLTPDTFVGLIIAGLVAGLIMIAWILSFSQQLGLKVQVSLKR